MSGCVAFQASTSSFCAEFQAQYSRVTGPSPSPFSPQEERASAASGAPASPDSSVLRFTNGISLDAVGCDGRGVPADRDTVCIGVQQSVNPLRAGTRAP